MDYQSEFQDDSLKNKKNKKNGDYSFIFGGKSI